jgi:hypothetical protein
MAPEPPLHDFVAPGWDWRVEIPDTDYTLVHWPAGALGDDREHFGFEHTHRYPDPDGVPVLARVAPKLDKHIIVITLENAGTERRANVAPSILCDCGLHGFLTGGRWSAA